MASQEAIAGFKVGRGTYGNELQLVSKEEFEAMSDEQKAQVVSPWAVSRGLVHLSIEQQGDFVYDLWNLMGWKPVAPRHLGHPTVMEQFVQFVIDLLSKEDYFDGRSSQATIELARTAHRIMKEGISRGFRGDYAPHIELKDD